MSSQELAGHPLFHSIRVENAKLYAEKHRQYATDADPMSNFRRCGTLIDKLLKPGVDRTLAAALTLMSKQVVGVYEIVGEQKENTIESLEDKLRDIEIYATICQVLLRENLTKEVGVEGNNYKVKYGDKAVGPPTSGGVIHLVKDGPYCFACNKLAELRSGLTGTYFCRRCVNEDLGLYTVLDGGKQ